MRGVAAAAVLAALSIVGSTAANGAAKPTISVVDRTPVVLRGAGFVSRERVLVIVRTELLRVTQRTTATTGGRFLVRFDGIRLAPCTGASIVALGARGHTAQLKLALRECPGPILDP
ncbi:MAG TPA: hypothetical protein VIP75_09410 [Acidothermales bacterium]